MIKDEVVKLLEVALKKSGVKDEKIDLQHPGNPDHGDYSTSLALKHAKTLKKSPLELAYEIIKNIPKSDLLEKVEVAKPGFVNLFLSPKTYVDELQKIIGKQDHAKKRKKDFKILIEFGQPNTHKIPHIGHLFSYIFGESLVRILEQEGNTVTRANYQGDVGLHVAKCLYVVKRETYNVKRLKTLKEKVDFLQKCYQEGSRLYERDQKVQKDIDRLNLLIYKKDPSILDLWNESRQWSLDYYKWFEKKLGVSYDRYYFESESGPLGKKIVEENVGRVFEKSEGAIVFRGEKYGLHTRVFITKYANPTYEAKDIGLVFSKMKDFPFDLSLVATANEQNEYWKVIIQVSQLLYPKLTGKLKHVGYGMINLEGGKMSSRKGLIIDAFSLVETVTEEIKKQYKTPHKLSEQIAFSVIKYSFLRSDYRKNMIFDFEKSIAKEGDSGPYLLYTYVRCQSVLKKISNFQFSSSSALSIFNINLNPEELSVIRKLTLFEDIVQEASRLYSPHLLASYLFDLAKTFNFFYQKHPILKAQEKQRDLRLALTQATGQILRSGLNLLGIGTVEKM